MPCKLRLSCYWLATVQCATTIATFATASASHPDALPTPTFYISFEQKFTPDIACPGTQAKVMGMPKFVKGVIGRALFVPRGCAVAFPTAKHINRTEGTIALWAKLEDRTNAPPYSRLFDMTGAGNVALRIVHPPNPWVPVYGVVRIGDQNYCPWPLGDALRRHRAWQHFAIAWNSEGATFYVNGVTLTASSKMPSLPALGEWFFIGNDATLQQPALTAIDEVYIFDRALRSHELCTLAKLPLETDLLAANLLPNSSFELGMANWKVVLHAEHESTVSITTADKHHGAHALLVDRRKVRTRRWSAVVLISPWLHLQRNELVTLSAWFKADRDEVPVKMFIQRGVKRGAIADVPRERELQRTIRVGRNWERFALTGKLPLAYKDAYRVCIIVLGKGCRVWIDAVQLNVGKLRAYEPNERIEIAVIPADGTTTFDTGARVKLQLTAYNDEVRPVNIKVQWHIRDPYGKVVREGELRKVLQGRQSAIWTMLSFTPALRGPHKLIARANSDDNRLIVEMQLPIAVIRDHSKTPSPSTSPFGAHGGDDLARAIGIAHIRDVSGMSWRWIEPYEGSWDYGQRPWSYARWRKMGISICATLIGVPSWAARDGAPDVPADIQHWIQYARRVMRDFGNYVSIWELWNEPDLSEYFMKHPEDYVKMLKAIYSIARQVSPNVKVAGVCPSGVERKAFAFAEEVFKLGALNYMDILSWHPYWHKQPEDGFDKLLWRIVQLMKQYGEVKPLIFTEYGTGGTDDERVFIPWYADAYRKFNELEQAQLLVRQSVIALAHGAIRLYWYKWTEERVEVGPDTFGLLRADEYRTPKPAAIAYNAMIWHLEHAKLPPKRIKLPRPSQRGYQFRTPKGFVYVLWDCNGASNIKRPNNAIVTDIWGNVLPNEQMIRLSPSPVYCITADPIT